MADEESALALLRRIERRVADLEDKISARQEVEEYCKEAFERDLREGLEKLPGASREVGRLLACTSQPHSGGMETFYHQYQSAHLKFVGIMESIIAAESVLKGSQDA